MAKFAIALCILLVACTGTQGDLASDLLEVFEAKVNEIKEAAESKIAELRELFENALANVENYIANLIGQAEAIAAEAEARKQALLEKYGNLNTCVSSNFDVKDIIEDFKQNAISCVSDQVSNTKNNYDQLHSAFDSLTDEAGAIIANTQTCKESGTNAVVCIVQGDYDDLKSNFDAVVAAGVTLASDLSSVKDTVKTCATETALGTVTGAIENYLRTFEACLAAA